MSLRQCGKCNEMVDEAKAFCPGCGNSFVDEVQRDESSSFDRLDKTVQFGQSMYDAMLSDMGLNISTAPDAGNIAVENAEPEPREIPQAREHAADRPAAGIAKWIIAGGIAIFLLILATILVLFVLRSSLT